MSDNNESGYIFRAQIDNCFVSDWNPRKTISDDGIHELAEGIKQTGIVQPPVARMVPDEPDRCEIIAGQRRFLAAKAAGETEIDVIIRELTDEEAAIVACQENDQREDLPPLDEAAMYRRMMDSFGWDAEELGARVGRSQHYVYKVLRLNENITEPQLREALNKGRLPIEGARQLARLSPRLQEEAVRILSKVAPLPETPRGTPELRWSTQDVSNVMRKLTPRVHAEMFLNLRSEGDEPEIVMDDKTRDACMDERGNLLPDSKYVNIEGKPDIAELKQGIKPRKWEHLLEEVGVLGDAVPVYRCVDKHYGCHRLVERELAMEAISAGGLTIFRSAPVSVCHAERLAAERAENLLWRKQWALVKEVVLGFTETDSEDGTLDSAKFVENVSALLEARLRATSDMTRLEEYLAPMDIGVQRLVTLACFVGCDDVTNDSGVLRALDTLLMDPKSILRKVEAECEAKRPDAPAKKKRVRKAQKEVKS